MLALFSTRIHSRVKYGKVLSKGSAPAASPRSGCRILGSPEEGVVANPELRIAPVTSVTSPESSAPIIVTGATRSWFRSRRAEPFAACLGLVDCPDQGPDLLAGLEAEFRASTRYSITTSLSRSVLAIHHELREENRTRGPGPPCRAAAIAAAASERGVYAVRVGPTLVGSVRSGGVWARSADPLRGGAANPVSLLGEDLEPFVTSEFFPAAPGDVILLVASVTVDQVPDYTLAAALRAAPDLDAVAALLAEAGPTIAGLMVWYPSSGTSAEMHAPWLAWSAQTSTAPTAAVPAPALTYSRRESPPQAVAPPVSPIPVVTDPEEAAVVEPIPLRQALPARRAGPTVARGAEPARAEPVLLDPVAPTRSGSARAVPVANARPGPGDHSSGAQPARPVRRAEAVHWTRFLPLIPLALVLALALFLMRVAFPFPSGGDQSVAQAGRIVQEALATPDEETRVALLDEAIATLERRAAGDDSARALLGEARTARDEALKITHVTRVHRFILPETENARPAGLWKSEGGLFILDLGSQLLQRTDSTGSRIDMAWRPGDQIAGEPLGRIVTAAWSPPRGVNTEGQLLIVDHLRSISAIAPNGATVRRWWPPDNGLWQRLGPAAATYDDLFILDPGASTLWRYAARLSGASATVAANTAQEPRLASAVDLATDGNVYLLYADGQISKLAPGSGRLPFEGRVPDRPLRGPNAIYANPDLDRIWVLEPGEARVVEFTPEGTYVRQFRFPPDMVRNAVGVNVDPKAGELRVLTTQHVLLVQIE
jgi:hypothetical protein